MDRRLIEIERKVLASERLSADDSLRLCAADVDLHWLGGLADTVRRRRHDDVTFYNINAHVNPTNVCIGECPLCAYHCRPDDAKAYEMETSDVLAAAAVAVRDGCTELHIVGGIHPKKPYGWYRDILACVHDTFPDLHLKAWTAAEIDHFATLESCSVEAILRDMIQAGLASLPGGGAEIFAQSVRERIAPRKISAGRWLGVHRTAHRLGLRTTSTMLFGHIETAEHRVDHLLRLRALQDETDGFQAFVPLSFHPEGTRLGRETTIRRMTAEEDLRVVALSRLVLDNFDHIKAYWVSLGVPTAQLAQGYGANDLDGTVRHERIHHDAGSTAPHALTVEALRRLIEESGRRPVERDSLYRPVERTAASS